MPTSRVLTLGDCRFELLCEGEGFLGLGEVHIGETLVRSGQLPLRPFTQTFKGGLELAELRLLEIRQATDEIRIRLAARFRCLEVQLVRDHSFDPIHDTTDWGAPRNAGAGEMDLVLRPAADSFNDVGFEGFSYGYEYRSEATPLFYLLDKATWELDGNIEGATVYSQSACSAPVVTFDKDTAWTTEGILFFMVEDADKNPVMTHNLPRWASHGSFDFQHKAGRTLIGVFERLELIRSILQRDPGKAQLKTFDKHIFDQTLGFNTSRKSILLNKTPKSLVEQQNLWTWIHCEVEERARREFGLKEEPFTPRLTANYWDNFTVDSYYKDLLPAAEGIGCQEVFVDNLKKSAMTERAPLPGVFNWNMCCSHEYEIAPLLGGEGRVRQFVNACRAREIRPVSWTCNSQALSSPLNNPERGGNDWFVLLEDSRQKYGGAYSAVMSVLDLGHSEARRYFVEAHIRIQQETGLDAYLFDSFYNLGFMPVTYRDNAPRTVWRGCLQAVKELQDAGVRFLIESFGPFGMPQHGHPSTYNLENIFICYRVGLGNDYSTVPAEQPLFAGHPDDASATFYSLAHMAGAVMPLFIGKQRIDAAWTPDHKRALRDYHTARDAMKTRYLQEDGASVVWHDAHGRRATVWNFASRYAALPGTVRDETSGEDLPRSETYALQAMHVYSIKAAELPRRVQTCAAGATP